MSYHYSLDHLLESGHVDSTNCSGNGTTVDACYRSTETGKEMMQAIGIAELLLSTLLMAISIAGSMRFSAHKQSAAYKYRSLFFRTNLLLGVAYFPMSLSRASYVFVDSADHSVIRPAGAATTPIWALWACCEFINQPTQFYMISDLMAYWAAIFHGKPAPSARFRFRLRVLQIFYATAMLGWFIAFWITDQKTFEVYICTTGCMTFTLAALTAYVAAVAAHRLHMIGLLYKSRAVMLPFAVCVLLWLWCSLVFFLTMLAFLGVHTFVGTWLHDAKSLEEWRRSYLLFHLSVYTIPNFIPAAVFSRVMWESSAISRQETRGVPSESRYEGDGGIMLDDYPERGEVSDSEILRAISTCSDGNQNQSAKSVIETLEGGRGLERVSMSDNQMADPSV